MDKPITPIAEHINAGKISSETGLWKPKGCEQMALVFQGGGALGAYQAGVYQALHEHDIEPDWVTGVSIGAINAAIIAGNPRERRLEKLRAFWERVTARPAWGLAPDGDIWRKMQNAASTAMTTALGQPGFFKPNPVSAWFSLPGAAAATAMYDTSPLRATLLDLVDFDSEQGDGRYRLAIPLMADWIDQQHDQVVVQSRALAEAEEESA